MGDKTEDPMKGKNFLPREILMCTHRQTCFYPQKPWKVLNEISPVPGVPGASAELTVTDKRGQRESEWPQQH